MTFTVQAQSAVEALDHMIMILADDSPARKALATSSRITTYILPSHAHLKREGEYTRDDDDRRFKATGLHLIDPL